MKFDELHRIPHKRFNPLLREWVLVSPHRTQRPWLGRVEKLQKPRAVTFDPGCYLCPGNRRAGGAQTPRYTETYVFDNDYPAMLAEVAPLQIDTVGLLVGTAEQGICRVMCFSPRHDLTVPRMSLQELTGVVNGWVEQYSALGQIPWIRHVQIFENRGEMMGGITVRYDNLFETAFPYSMGFHQKPTDGGTYEEWHLHAHYFPPLLRSATIQKFMVGYELLGSPQRDVTPERAAVHLIEAGETQYLDRNADQG